MNAGGWLLIVAWLVVGRPDCNQAHSILRGRQTNGTRWRNILGHFCNTSFKMSADNVFPLLDPQVSSNFPFLHFSEHSDFAHQLAARMVAIWVVGNIHIILVVMNPQHSLFQCVPPLGHHFSSKGYKYRMMLQPPLDLKRVVCMHAMCRINVVSCGNCACARGFMQVPETVL